MDCFDVMLPNCLLSDAPSVPSCPIPYKQNLLSWVDLADRQQYGRCFMHSLALCCKCMLLACLEVQKPIDAPVLSGSIGLNYSWCGSFRYPHFLSSCRLSENHLVFTENHRIWIRECLFQTFLLLVFPFSYCLWISLLVLFARQMEAELTFPKQNVIASPRGIENTVSALEYCSQDPC
ncbi:hypothetical protein AXFE_06530 [Acidithrix ferrooxidans]|uniref:Uncharacterized protein n=1 Tax=Acidithrix ferrooxidans TaxID=1280514 RepID=A0A0D8HMX5_9ACTN|nr:hypothetical protein AXFE_06530 [Acidithrix ferrooxidans]